MSSKLYNKRDEERIVVVKKRKGAPDEPFRTAWRRDYARLIHSAAFRRLQGKTQLFPSGESDYSRNRLTHSLEVAQIAKSIAIQLNSTHPFFKVKTRNIEPDLVELAGLAHDLGHPPFGHNGEKALDIAMKAYGGFEGNAQTLHILGRLEKKQTIGWDKANVPETVNDKGADNRCGLNLCARTLAAILKYDNEIKEERKTNDDLAKGYYSTDAEIVKFIKKNTAGFETNPADVKKFKTVECCIMDIADDIAYSTYDLEDAFKAGFATPIGMLSASENLIKKVSTKVAKQIQEEYPDARPKEKEFNQAHARTLIMSLFNGILEHSAPVLERKDINEKGKVAGIIMSANSTSRELANNGYFRTDFTSFLVGRFMNGIEVIPNEKYPLLSVVRLKLETFKEVELLKRFTFETLIMHPRLKIAESRGQEIVDRIFKKLVETDGNLLPHDFQAIYRDIKSPAEKKRVICDFIAGMTDRYALEFYDRLFGTSAQSVYKPI